jgi:tetratricopeptide (TPR) repeat protein
LVGQTTFVISLMLLLGAICFFFPMMSPEQQVEQLVAFGQWGEAFNLLSQLISDRGRKSEPRWYRLRAFCAVNMAKYRESIDDTTIVINGRGSPAEKGQCYEIRANVYLQTGDFEKALSDAVASKNKQLIGRIEDAIRTAQKVEEATKAGDVEAQERLLDQLIRIVPHAVKYVLQRGDLAWEKGMMTQYFELTRPIVGDLPKDGLLHSRRGWVAFCLGDVDGAQKILKKAKGLRGSPKNTSHLLTTLANLQKHTHETARALSQGRHNDAEAALDRAVTAATEFCSADADLLEPLTLLRVRLLRGRGDTQAALALLNEKINSKPDSPSDFYVERGEILLDDSDYDAALFDFQNALTHDRGNTRAHEGLEKAQDLKRQTERVDHYSILDVKPDATLEAIKDGYRKKVREWHPDRHHDPAKKQESEVMMKKINTAMEILGDPEKRRAYDLGQNPDEVQGGGGGMDLFEFMRQTMGGGAGNPFDFLFGGGGGGGGGGQQHGFQRIEFHDGGGFQFQFQF